MCVSRASRNCSDPWKSTAGMGSGVEAVCFVSSLLVGIVILKTFEPVDSRWSLWPITMRCSLAFLKLYFAVFFFVSSVQSP